MHNHQLLYSSTNDQELEPHNPTMGKTQILWEAHLRSFKSFSAIIVGSFNWYCNKFFDRIKSSQSGPWSSYLKENYIKSYKTNKKKQNPQRSRIKWDKCP